MEALFAEGYTVANIAAGDPDAELDVRHVGLGLHVLKGLFLLYS